MSIAASFTKAQLRLKCFSGSYGVAAAREVMRVSMRLDLRLQWPSLSASRFASQFAAEFRDPWGDTAK